MPGDRMSMQEVRDARPLGGVRVGAGEQQAPVGVQGAAGPQLLTVDDVARRRPCGRSCAGWPDRTRLRARRSPGHQISPSRIAGRCRRRCSSVPAASRVDGGVVDPDERQHQSRGVVGRQLLVEHDLLGRRTCRRPTPPASAERRSRPGAAPGTTTAGTRRTRRRRRRSAAGASRWGCGCGSTRARRRGTRRVRRSSWRDVEQPGQTLPTEPAGQLVAGGREAERQAPQRLAVARQPGQRRLVAEADRAVQLVARPGTPSRPPRWPPAAGPARRRGRRRARPRCSTARTSPAPRGRCARPRRRSAGTARPGTTTAAGRTARARRHSATVSSMARSSMPSSVQHGSTSPSATSSRTRRRRPRSRSSSVDEGGPARRGRCGRAAAQLRRPSNVTPTQLAIETATGPRPGPRRPPRPARRRRGRPAGSAARRPGTATAQ